MMSAKTSLARQLELLKLPQTSAQKERHGAVSFLYEFFEAKTIDADTHFSVALVGLRNLIQLDPSIELFKETIFHESSKKFDRGVQNRETNEKIDLIIEEFLFRVVSKYFLLTDTHKALEWLIYRYRIAEYNYEALIGCTLPYHETRHFVRLLQTVSAIKNPQNSRFHWLKTLQEGGLPLDKSVLIRHCVADPEFIRFVTDTVFKAIQIDPSNSNFPSFLVSFCIVLLERSTNEVIISLMVSVLSKALRMRNKQLYTAAYMIVAHLCAVAQLDEEVVKKLLKTLLKRIEPDLHEGLFLSLNIVCKTQHLKRISTKLITNELISSLVKHCHSNRLQHLMRAVTLTIISQVEANELEEDELDKYKNYIQLLFEVKNEFVTNVVGEIVEVINQRDEEEMISEQRADFEGFLFMVIKKTFPGRFDAAISNSVIAEEEIVEEKAPEEPVDESLWGQLRKIIIDIWKVRSVSESASAELTRLVDQAVSEWRAEKTTDEWYLTDIEKLPSYYTCYQLYHALVHFSTPNESKALPKKIYRFYRPFFAQFIKQVTCKPVKGKGKKKDKEPGFELDFFLPILVDCDTAIQQQTLSLLIHYLDEYESMTSFSTHHLLAYLIALTSSHETIRELALVNLQKICKKINEPESLVHLLRRITRSDDNNKANIIASASEIGSLIGREHRKAMKHHLDTALLQCLSVICSLLTSGASATLERKHRGSLIRLLSNSSDALKSTILKTYVNKFATSLSDDDEFEIKCLLKFYLEMRTLRESKQAIEFFHAAIKASGKTLSEEVSLEAYRVLDRERFEAWRKVDENRVLELVIEMLRVQLVLSESSSARGNSLTLIYALREQLQMVTNDGEFIVKILERLLPIEEIYETFAYAKPSSEKRLKVDEEGNIGGKNRFSNGWKLLRIYVGLFQNGQNLQSTTKLMKTLFEYLKLTFMEVDDNSNEYTRQTLLYAIVNCVELRLAKKSGALKRDQTKVVSSESNTVVEQGELEEFMRNINVDVIINCMIESRVKETQKVSLLLLGLIGPYFHREIIESLVAIFTFIGTNLLHCDDQYSLAILFETMESIVPIVLQNDQPEKLKAMDRKKLSPIESDLKQYIISIFIKSFFDIPSYRRMELFTKLIQLLGEEQFLPMVTVRLLEHATLLKSKNGKAEKDVCFSFLLDLFGKFSSPIQLSSVCTLLTLFEGKFFDSHIKKKSLQKQLLKERIEKQHSGMEVESEKCIVNINHLKLTAATVCKQYNIGMIYDSDKLACGVDVLRFIVSLISLQEFVQAVKETQREKASTVLIYFLSLLLELIVSLSPGDSSMKASLNMHRKRIKITLDEMLLKYHNLVPHYLLIKIVLNDLMENTAQLEPMVAILVKRKGLELLNDLLIKLNKKDMREHDCLKILRVAQRHLPEANSNIRQLEDVEMHNVQLLMLSLKLTTKFFEPKLGEGGEEEEVFSEKVLKQLTYSLVQIVAIGKSIVVDDDVSARNKQLLNLKGSCILCATQILSAMSLEGIPHLASVLDIVLSNFDTKDSIIILSNVSALSKIIVRFAQFLSPHLGAILLKLLGVFTLCESIPNLRPKLEMIWNNLAKNVPKRVIFDAINSSYEKACKVSPTCIVELMTLFKLSCDHIEKSDVDIIVKSFKDFMIKALSYRSIHYTDVNLAVIERIEGSLGEAFSAFIPKLTESTFRPIFFKLLEWAVQIENSKIREESSSSLPDQCYHRLIAFYRFSAFLADRLKSLFCVFVAPSIVNNCSEMLRAYHSANFVTQVEGEEAAFQEGSKTDKHPLKLQDSNLGEPLVSAILSTMAKCFLYDLSGSFVNKDHTALFIKPIVNQLSNLLGTSENYEARLDLILQCTQYLIQNNKDESLIKDFNYQILLKTRESDERVRVGAVKVLHRLMLTCSEDYLPFIPEAIPFIAELSEDDSDLVESHLKKLIIDIEQLIGEPIQKYL